MEMRQLRYFVAVAEELHFGRAAARLNISQPPLSQQILKLEEELGVRLFLRNKHKVELTEAGDYLLGRAAHILSEAAAAMRDTKRAEDGQIGYLEIGHSPSADLIVLPKIIAKFKLARPDVGLRFNAMNSIAQIEALRRNAIQIGVVRLPIEPGEHHVVPVFREPLVVVIPARHRLSGRRTVRLRDLANEPMVLFPRKNSPAYFDLIATICRKAGFILNVAQECETIQTVISLVAMGSGISLQPESVKQMKRRGVVFRPLEPPAPVVEIGVAYMPQNRSRAVAEFVAIARGIQPDLGAP